MKESFRDVGITVRFQTTSTVDEKLPQLAEECAKTVKDLVPDYFGKLGKAVEEGTRRGRDLEYIQDKVTEISGLELKKAVNIARDQSQRMTQTIRRMEDEEFGITQGIWVHVPGRLTSRENHKHFNGKLFDLSGEKAGLYDDEFGGNVVPGFLRYCACTYKSVLPDWATAGINTK